MPPEKDWRAPPDEAGDDALQYSEIAIGYLGRNARYRSDYRRALGRVKRGAISADDATATRTGTTSPNRPRTTPATALCPRTNARWSATRRSPCTP